MALTIERPDVVAPEEPTPAPPAPRRDGATTLLFAATAFLASGLLFAVEPMVARLLLPELGGSAAVWNTAMVFFQASLLAGYLVAHLGFRHLPDAVQRVGQLALLAGAGLVLPVALPGGWQPPTGDPVWWTFAVLAVAVGLPFVALSTMSPTLQRWLAATDHRSGDDPYFLYAAGNAGSFLALLAYPLLIEPSAGVRAQVRGWAFGYAVLVVLAAACALVAHRRRSEPVAPSAPGDKAGTVRRADALRWVAIAAVPSALLLGVTRHLATDVASIPLLWVVPLALYLLTFVLAFSPRRPWLGRGAAAAGAVLVVPALLGWVGPDLGGPAAHIAVALAAFTALSLAAHRRLWDERPPAADLTAFYLWVSLGGVVGGVAAALVAPVVFDSVLEYPLAVAAGLAVLAKAADAGRSVDPERRAVLARIAVGVAGGCLLLVGDGAVQAVGALGVAVWAGSVFLRAPLAGGGLVVAAVLVVAGFGTPDVIRRERTFYGVSLVEDIGGAHQLQSGTTIHGVQRTGAGAGEPLTYYTRSGPVGQLFDELRSAGAGAGGSLDVGAIGLGAGSIAAYAEAGDRMAFYEIDPAVVEIASDPSLFTYLSDAEGDVSVHLGDGRLLLERADGVRHDLLVLDAFSSDAIPVHLLTTEAFAVYTSHLAAGGTIAVHISSRFFDLAPQVAAQAAHAGLGAVELVHVDVPDPLGRASDWLVLSADRDLLDSLRARGWFDPPAAERPWTDDRSDLLATLKL